MTTSLHRSRFLIGLILTLGWLAPSAAVAESPSRASNSGDVSFGQLWRQGGWAMYPLAAFSVAAFALIFYNSVTIRDRPLLRPEVTGRLQQMLSEPDLAAARQLCAATPGIVANITAAGLARAHPDRLDPGAVEKAMEEASVEELAGPYVVIGYLSIIATLSPMVGMLGTVSGMIKAFRNIALGGMGKPELLADNISEALITTAVGLIVGIPAMFAYYFFKSRYARITSRVSRVCGDLHHTLVAACAAGKSGSLPGQ